METTTIVFAVIIVALVFEYINGFHDTANSIATVVGTKVLTPRQAIMLAACTNLGGAFTGLAVAKTVAGGLVNPDFINQGVLIGALLGAIIWNLLTWWFGLPSSSTHALVGGLAGAVLAVGVMLSSAGKLTDKDGKPQSLIDTCLVWSGTKDKSSKKLVEPSPEVLGRHQHMCLVNPKGGDGVQELGKKGVHALALGTTLPSELIQKLW
jgi:hypothetical protein